MPFVRLNCKFPLSDNVVYRTKATLVSGGGGLVSHPDTNNVVIAKNLPGDESVGFEDQPNGTLAEDTGLTGNFSDDEHDDLDSPTPGFASIPEAIEDIRQGKVATRYLCLLNISTG